MAGLQASVKVIQIPGVEGIVLVYSPERTDVNVAWIEAAGALLARWFAPRELAIEPQHVRQALRCLSSPWLLADTELACRLFDATVSRPARGAALQTLLRALIEQLDVGTEAPKERRVYLVARQLYVERRLPQQISSELQLSSRQYQRCLSAALQRLSHLLSEHYANGTASLP